MIEAIVDLLSGEHLFDPNPGPASPYYAIFGFIFAVIAGASLALYLKRSQATMRSALLLKIVTPIAIIGMVAGGVGVILVLGRFFTVPFLSMRILLYLWILITLGLGGYAVYFVRRTLSKVRATPRGRYPSARYVPRPVPKAGSRKKKGKRRK